MINDDYKYDSEKFIQPEFPNLSRMSRILLDVSGKLFLFSAENKCKLFLFSARTKNEIVEQAGATEDSTVSEIIQFVKDQVGHISKPVIMSEPKKSILENIFYSEEEKEIEAIIKKTEFNIINIRITCKEEQEKWEEQELAAILKECNEREFNIINIRITCMENLSWKEMKIFLEKKYPFHLDSKVELTLIDQSHLLETYGQHYDDKSFCSEIEPMLLKCIIANPKGEVLTLDLDNVSDH